MGGGGRPSARCDNARLECWQSLGTRRLFDFYAYAQSNRAFCGTALHINGMHNFLANLHGRARLDQGDHFFAYNLLFIEFKGILMKLKNVAYAISVE